MATERFRFPTKIGSGIDHERKVLFLIIEAQSSDEDEPHRFNLWLDEERATGLIEELQIGLDELRSHAND